MTFLVSSILVSVAEAASFPNIHSLLKPHIQVGTWPLGIKTTLASFSCSQRRPSDLFWPKECDQKSLVASGILFKKLMCALCFLFLVYTFLHPVVWIIVEMSKALAAIWDHRNKGQTLKMWSSKLEIFGFSEDFLDQSLQTWQCVACLLTFTQREMCFYFVQIISLDLYYSPI